MESSLSDMSKKIDDVRTEVNVKFDNVKKQNDEVNKQIDIKHKELNDMLERVSSNNRVPS